MSQPLLLTQALCKTYTRGGEAITALDGVSLSVERAEFLTVAGPSGSGKTTLLNTLGLLDRPDSGTLHVDGAPVDWSQPGALTALRRRWYGFVFQRFNLIPVLTARENVALALLERGYSEKTIQEKASVALERVGLTNRQGHRPRELSGGQQQRVAIARALVDEPAVIFADEPTANLDSVTAVSILDLLQHLVQTLSTTVVISTHDPKVLGYASRQVHIRDGRLQEQDR